MEAVQRAQQLEGQAGELRQQGQEAADAAQAVRAQLAEAVSARDAGAVDLEAARQQVSASALNTSVFDVDVTVNFDGISSNSAVDGSAQWRPETLRFRNAFECGTCSPGLPARADCMAWLVAGARARQAPTGS